MEMIVRYRLNNLNQLTNKFLNFFSNCRAAPYYLSSWHCFSLVEVEKHVYPALLIKDINRTCIANSFLYCNLDVGYHQPAVNLVWGQIEECLRNQDWTNYVMEGWIIIRKEDIAGKSDHSRGDGNGGYAQ